MTDKELNRKYAEVCSNLAARRLKPAFDMVGNLIASNGLGIYYDEYRRLEETYHYMLQYTVEGIRDPERQKVYRKLIVSVFELADKVNEGVRLKSSTSVVYDKKRIFKTGPVNDMGSYLREIGDYYLDDTDQYSRAGADSPAGDSPAARQQQKMRKLFYHIWFNDKMAEEEIRHLRKFLLSPGVPEYYKSFIIAAIMLALLRFFDTVKFTLLFDAYGSEEAEISQRALAGLLINIYKYDDRLPYYPEITDRLYILDENADFRKNLERIILQLIRSKETEKLQQRIRDELLPGMIKISPHLKNKINLDSLMEEGLPDDKNPEWQEIFKDSPGLLNKMEEFSEMQMKGADVFMGSFSMLKSFPFFNEIDNWFIPFFPENPELFNTVDMADEPVRHMMEAIEMAPILCNSDKYSLCFSISRMPRENLEFMTQAMKSEMDQLKEVQDDEALLDPGRKAGFISNQYIQDLYRFYKLFPRKGDFEDIFNWRFDFHNKITAGRILKEDPKVLRNIAEYYFAANNFEEAAGIFIHLLEQEKSGELYQKLAFCHQKRGDYERALDYYQKAELYEVNKLWNLNKIALCYRNLNQPDMALDYYLATEKIDPDNLNNQLNIGHCLLELKRFDQALKCYFKVEYLAPGNKKVWRPIAWCSFLTGKKDQAEKYLLKLISDEPNRHDLINMGHVRWSMGDRKAAIENYKRSISKKNAPADESGTSQNSGSAGKNKPNDKGGFTQAEFLEVFEEDLPHLISQGIDSEDVPIMLDQLRYFLEE